MYAPGVLQTSSPEGFNHNPYRILPNSFRFLVSIFVLMVIIGACVMLPWAHCAHAAVLWIGDSEEGDLRDWYWPCTSAAPCGIEGGGEFNSGGGGDSAITSTYVYSGSYAVTQTINSSVESGTRLFRWAEAQSNSALYYSTWNYLPQGFAPVDGYGWWMMEGWKVRRTQGGPVANLLHLELDYTYNPDQMYVRLLYYPPGGGARQRYTQRVKALPVGRWFMLETYVRASTALTGQIIVWLDGVEIFNINNIVTRGSGTDGAPQWEITNYGYNLSPTTVTKYVDDAVISTTRIGVPTLTPNFGR